VILSSIRTERLLLGQAKASDLDAFHDILSKPEAMAFWSTLPHHHIARTQE
jgi:RimJ/RimL family protein N-acetyltransferase